LGWLRLVELVVSESIRDDLLEWSRSEPTTLEQHRQHLRTAEDYTTNLETRGYSAFHLKDVSQIPSRAS
jgi:hypothetical protein